MTSRQEEDLFALTALQRLGEATRDDVALDLGVPSVFRTLVRLEAEGRIVSRKWFDHRRHCPVTLFRVADDEDAR